MHYAHNSGYIHIESKVSLAQIFIMSYECLFEAGGIVKVSMDHSLPPGHGGDVGPDLSINFLGNHAEDAEVPH